MIPILFLIVYNLLFWRHHYANPFRQSTGEFLSTYFPHWRWCGQLWSKGRLPATDRIYYQYPGCIPFLSTWYPPHIFSSLLSVRLPLDWQFTLLAWSVYAHFAAGSLLSFLLFTSWGYSNVTALFGAITLTYSGYMIKPQNPCIVFTNAWLTGCLIPGWIGIVSMGMAILGGYWPVLIYFVPVAVLLNPSCALGLLLGLPQIIPFCWYWPKSIRHGRKTNGKFGAVPLGRFIDLLVPDLGRTSINGVLFTEMSMYCGVLGFLFSLYGIAHHLVNLWTIVCILSFIFSMGFAPFRIAARWLHLFTYSLVISAVAGMSCVRTTQAAWFLLLLQAFDLARNAGLQPIWPFCEWTKKPSQYMTKGIKYLQTLVGNHRVSGLPFPFFTGYLLNIRTLGYTGGFSLKKMCEFRGVTDPNGESAHGTLPAMSNEYGVLYHFKNGKFYLNEEVKAPHPGDILEELECLAKANSSS